MNISQLQGYETLKNQLQQKEGAKERIHQTVASIEKETTKKKEKQLKTITEKIAKSEINISFHEKSNQMIIKLIDPQTKELLKEIPPEKLVDFFAELCEVAGLFLDEKL